MIIISAAMVASTHLSYLLMPDCEQCIYSILPLILLGFGFSIYASVIWSSIPFVVIPKTIGTAFGLGFAIQNLGLALAPMIIGLILDDTDSYSYVSLFLFCVGVFGIFSGILLGFADKARGGILNISNPI